MAINYNSASKHNWRLNYHLQVPAGNLTDPNGLCQFKGIYHVFHQYVPKWPRDGHGWGHWSSPDLVSWTFEGIDIKPDCALDANGSYSGSAVVRDGQMWCYYTGNVLEEGDHDYDFSGRQANETLLVSPDGHDFGGEKRLVLANDGYPGYCSNHVRDPKVWSEDGVWYMLLGARSNKNRGCVLLYRSADGLSWEFAGSASNAADKPFGYMWECPNIARVDGREYLLVCPQGVSKRMTSHQNVHDSGYFALPEGVIKTIEGVDPALIDERAYRALDYGFDFYAPQVFEDEKGRTILYGWMGLPDIESQYENPSREWNGTLTVPRQLSAAADGRLLQWPVSELDGLRGEEVRFLAEDVAGATGTVGSARFDAYDMEGGVAARFAGCSADVVIEGIQGEGRVMLGGDLELALFGSMAELAFTGPAGQFRTVRRLPFSALSAGRIENLRILVDTSTVEVFVNDGEVTLSTRWYPEDIDSVAVSSTLAGAHRGYQMNGYTFEVRG